MRPVGASRAAVMAIALGLVVASCAADPSSTQPPPGAGSGGDGEQAAPTPATGTPATDAPEAGAPEASASEGAPPAASADRTVTWLDTEFLLPAPWELRFVDGGDVMLRHPTAAGAGGAFTVLLGAEDGRPSAASMAAIPIQTQSGATVPTVELPAVFATGGPGLRITWPDDGSTLIVSDTGITIGISRDEGTVPEAAVAAVLALVATIEPPTVTPAAESLGRVTAPEPSRPTFPLRSVAFGPPFPADPPVAVDPALPLVQVLDFPRPGDRCFGNGVEYACDDPEYLSALGPFGSPYRSWLYLLPSEAAMEPACQSLLTRAVAAGGTFSSFRPAEWQCVFEVAHGARVAAMHIYLPDGSLYWAVAVDDSSTARMLGACGEPCPALVVELRFP